MTRKMKDSGVEWIGVVPDNWNVGRLGAVLADRNESNNPVKTDVILSLTNDRGVILYADKGNHGNKSKDDITQYKLAYPNDIVLNSMNVIIGSVGLSPYFGAVSPVYYMLYPRNEKTTSIRFFDYIFQTTVFQQSLRGYGNGIMEIRMRIQMQKLKTVMLAYPSKAEQDRIVRILDAKCASIDDVIAKTNESIEEYKKLKQAVITEAVTKGVRGKRPMKDSGVDWIDVIPKDWSTIRLKTLFSFGKGLPITKDNLLSEGVSVISYGQIHSKTNTGTSLKSDLIRFVSSSYLTSNPDSLVNRGDFIFADTSEDLDGCGNCVYVDSQMQLFAGYHTIICSSRNKRDARYLAYLFKTDCWRSQIRSNASGVKVYSVSRKMLGNADVFYPTHEEQKEIADYLDSKCAAIDTLISKKQQFIDELTAYKKSLIYEYVTGKKEVPA